MPDREYALREEVLDRINGLPPIYMPELDGPIPPLAQRGLVEGKPAVATPFKPPKRLRPGAAAKEAGDESAKNNEGKATT